MRYQDDGTLMNKDIPLRSNLWLVGVFSTWLETLFMAESKRPSRHDRFLGNTPLLFSQVEYVFAAREISKAREAALGLFDKIG
jgi:hypothetical protein